MNKKQFRKIVAQAVAFSNELDAQRAGSMSDRNMRSWARLDAFLCSLAGDVADEMPDMAEAISGLRDLASRNENPLLDAAGSNKEKPE